MSRRAVALALLTGLAWGAWRLGRPEAVFGVSTDDHARILAAWAIRDGSLAPGDVWAPFPTVVTGIALLLAPFPRVVPGLVNLGWSALAVGAVASRGRTASAAVAAAAVLALNAWFGWLSVSALAEPAALAFLALMAVTLDRATTRREVWPAVVAGAVAGACRYEAWALLVILPVALSRLPGGRRELVAQVGALLLFPVGWSAWHGVVNGAPFGYLTDTLDSVRLADPEAPAVSHALADLGDLAGPSLLLLAFAVRPSPAVAVLFGLEAAVIGAQLLGATGVHTGSRHHLPALLALSLHAGTIADGLSRRRRFAVAVVLALALALLPRLDRPPAAHPEAIEIVGRGVSDLLERSRSGVVIIDLLDDEALAVRTLSGDPDRAILAGEDVSVRRWRAGTNNAGVRVSAGILIARPDVLGLVTTREIATGDTRILAHSGEYVLLGR